MSKFEQEECLPKPLSVDAMTREQLDAELQKGMDSINAGNIYSADEVDEIFAAICKTAPAWCRNEADEPKSTEVIL